MITRRKKTAIAVAAGAIVFVLSLWTFVTQDSLSPVITSAGPELVGEMQSFQMTTSPRPGNKGTWKNSAGQDISLANFSGKVVMLNFWASWCSPCLRELPSINRLQAHLAGDQFTVVALNVDRGGKAVASRYTRRLNLDKLDLYLDQDNTAARAGK